MQSPEPAPETVAKERRKKVRIAMRQLENADLYLAAVASLELDDYRARRSIDGLRGELLALLHYLGDLKAKA